MFLGEVFKELQCFGASPGQEPDRTMHFLLGEMLELSTVDPVEKQGGPVEKQGGPVEKQGLPKSHSLYIYMYNICIYRYSEKHNLLYIF